MKLSSIPFYLRRPQRIFYQLRARLYDFRHPGEPWISPDATRFCKDRLNREMSGLEWGSGRSTLWFGERLGSLISVEHDPAWYERVAERVRASGKSNIRLRFLPLEDGKTAYGHYDIDRPYVRVAQEFADGSLDFVVVDGAYREACISAAIPKLKPGGYLLVDNTHWMPLEKWGVPAGWAILHRSENGVTETTIWQKPQRG